MEAPGQRLGELADVHQRPDVHLQPGFLHAFAAHRVAGRAVAGGFEAAARRYPVDVVADLVLDQQDAFVPQQQAGGADAVDQWVAHVPISSFFVANGAPMTPAP
ncbi:hypothetical protein D3C81_2034230 [compost metagenome]